MLRYKMEKNYKRALLLLIKSIGPLELHEGEYGGDDIASDIRDLLENIMESDKDFDDYMMMKHAEDYHGFDDDMPDAFDSWLCDLDSDERYEYFISFLNS